MHIIDIHTYNIHTYIHVTQHKQYKRELFESLECTRICELSESFKYIPYLNSTNNGTKIVIQEAQLSLGFAFKDRLINSLLLSLFLSLPFSPTLSHTCILGVFGYFITRRMCASNTASCFIRLCVCVCLFGFVLFRGISSGLVLLPPSLPLSPHRFTQASL